MYSSHLIEVAVFLTIILNIIPPMSIINLNIIKNTLNEENIFLA